MIPCEYRKVAAKTAVSFDCVGIVDINYVLVINFTLILPSVPERKGLDKRADGRTTK